MKKTIGIILIGITIIILVMSLFSCQDSSSGDNFSLGEKYLENKQYARAIDSFEKALNENPYNYEIYMQLAHAYYANGNIYAALGVLEDGIRITSNSSDDAVFYVNQFLYRYWDDLRNNGANSYTVKEWGLENVNINSPNNSSVNIFDIRNINDLNDALNSFSDFNNIINRAQKNIVITTGFFILLFGLIQCLFGYKLFKIWLGIVGFIVGALIGAAIGGIVSTSVAGAVIGALLIGALFAFLFVKLYFIGVFLTVGFISSVVLLILFKNIAIALLIGFIIGIIGAIIKKYVIICSTAISGAFLSGLGLALMFGQEWLYIVFGVILSVVGILFQIFRNKKESKNKKNVTSKIATANITIVPVVLETNKIMCDCGKENDAEAKFCTECGKEIVKSIITQNRFCHKCGAELVYGVKFCGVCGVPVLQNYTGRKEPLSADMADINLPDTKEKTANIAKKGILKASELFNNIKSKLTKSDLGETFDRFADRFSISKFLLFIKNKISENMAHKIIKFSKIIFLITIGLSMIGLFLPLLRTETYTDVGNNAPIYVSSYGWNNYSGINLILENKSDSSEAGHTQIFSCVVLCVIMAVLVLAFKNIKNKWRKILYCAILNILIFSTVIPFLKLTFDGAKLLFGGNIQVGMYFLLIVEAVIFRIAEMRLSDISENRENLHIPVKIKYLILVANPVLIIILLLILLNINHTYYYNYWDDGYHMSTYFNKLFSYSFVRMCYFIGIAISLINIVLGIISSKRFRFFTYIVLGYQIISLIVLMQVVGFNKMPVLSIIYFVSIFIMLFFILRRNQDKTITQIDAVSEDSLE